MSKFSILAPVPLEHLQSGEKIARDKGFVAFGSRKFELFRKVDELRKGEPVPVLIYPSHEENGFNGSYLVSWFGWYIDSEESDSGHHSQGMEHRPPTTAAYSDDNNGHWSVFWHVKNLTQLPKADWFPISKVQTIKGGWRKNAPPRGPELVDVPTNFVFPE